MRKLSPSELVLFAAVESAISSQWSLAAVDAPAKSRIKQIQRDILLIHCYFIICLPSVFGCPIVVNLVFCTRALSDMAAFIASVVDERECFVFTDLVVLQLCGLL